jgi:hypothetical protein
MNFRDSASFGKRQEFAIISELLRRDFDVYMTLVDDKGIDCVIRQSSECYIDVQIKARSKNAKHHHFFAALSFTPRKNLWFIFYTEVDDNYWILQSTHLDKIATRNVSGINKGKRHIRFPTSEKGRQLAKYSPYLNESGFGLLKNYRST